LQLITSLGFYRSSKAVTLIVVVVVLVVVVVVAIVAVKVTLYLTCLNHQPD